MTSLAPHMEAFLREHLVRHRGVSPHTCDSYAYSFQSLFEFASQKLKAAPSALMLEQLDAALISGFLEHLETTRGNSAETRNIRLAAIRSFFQFLQHREPGAVEQVRRILAIPFKRTDTRLVPYLVQKETQALLDSFRAKSSAGKVTGILPVDVAFPAFGPSVFLVSELTSENQSPAAEFSFQREKKGGVR